MSMTLLRAWSVLAALILTLSALPTDASGQSADTVFMNGRIYTVEADRPWAEALAVEDGRARRGGLERRR